MYDVGSLQDATFPTFTTATRPWLVEDLIKVGATNYLGEASDDAVFCRDVVKNLTPRGLEGSLAR